MEKEISSKLSVASVETSKIQKSRSETKPVKRKFYRRLTVSREFRQLTEETFPAIKENISYRRLLHYLLFGCFFDRDHGRLIISQKVLADIEGKKGALGTYCGETLLKNFQSEVMTPATFQWTKWIGGKKARQVKTFILPPEFEKAFHEERELPYSQKSKKVDFCYGDIDSPRKQQVERDASKAEAEALFYKADCVAAQEILRYLNNLPQNLFTSIVKENFDSAMLVAKGIENKRTRERNRRLLHSLRDQPQRFYAPSKGGKTVRLYEIGGGITNLKGEVRRALTTGWSEADLRSSQLAICAKIWGITELEAFLRSEKNNIWEALGAHFSLGKEELIEAKPGFKKALYSTCYGKQKHKIVYSLRKALERAKVKRDAALFFTHPLTEALLAAREAQITKINKDRGAETCFGKKLVIQKGFLDVT